MKRLLLALLLIAPAAEAASPCIFSGTYVRCLAKDGILLDKQKELRFEDATGPNYVALKAPAAVTTPLTWILPPADGVAGEALTTDGAGNLVWAAAGGFDPAADYTLTGEWDFQEQIGGIRHLSIENSTGNIFMRNADDLIDFAHFGNDYSIYIGSDGTAATGSSVDIHNPTFTFNNTLDRSLRFIAGSYTGLASISIPGANTYSFPNLTSTVAGLEVNQTFTGQSIFQQFALKNPSMPYKSVFDMSLLTTVDRVVSFPDIDGYVLMAEGLGPAITWLSSTPGLLNRATFTGADAYELVRINAAGTGLQSVPLTVGTTGSDVNISTSSTTHVINVPDAGASARGVVTTGTQTFAGNKTFNGTTSLGITQLRNGAFYGYLNLTGITATRGYVFPDADGNIALVPSAGYVTSDGTALSQQAYTGNGNKVAGVNSAANGAEYKTIAVGTSGTDVAVAHAAGSITINVPDAGASARGVVTTGTQTIAGDKTFTGTTTIAVPVGGTGGNVNSGVGTCAYSTGVNVNATASPSCMYFRVGNNIHVSGVVDIQTSAASTASEAELNLPVGSNLDSEDDLQGVASHGQASTPYASARVRANPTGDRAVIVWYSGGDTASRQMSYTYTYKVQ